MAVTRSRARGQKSRAVLAGGLLALAALMQLPARAATQPVLVESSIAGGWSDGRSIVLQFDRTMRCTTADADNKAGAECEATQSQINVTLPDGTAVAGKTILSFSTDFLVPNVLVWRPVLPANHRAIDAGAYKATVHAVPFTGDFVDLGPYDFKVDNGQPHTPGISAPASGDVLMGGEIELTGVATDRIGTAGFVPAIPVTGMKSGIARVEIQFYNALDPSSYRISAPQNGAGEIRSLRRFAAIEACATTIARCTAENEFGTVVVAHDVAWSTKQTLHTGLWSIRVIAFDAAGNGSIAGERTFVVVG